MFSLVLGIDSTILFYFSSYYYYYSWCPVTRLNRGGEWMDGFFFLLCILRFVVKLGMMSNGTRITDATIAQVTQ